ncbi:hypothetical protein CF319_g4425 [Tilletia indica]|nr:hypothetical protein CF319_g4425 [Tilletia indica]
MAALNPYAAGYRTQAVDLASSSPVFRPVADATSSPSPPSSPIPAITGDLVEQSFRSGAMHRPRTPPRMSDPSSPPFAVSDAFDPPIFTSSSPSLDQASVSGSAALSSPPNRASLDFSSSFTSSSSSTAASAMMSTQLKSASTLTHPLSAHSKASSLTMHPSFGKTYPHSKYPHPESPNRKRGLKRPLPLSPEKPSARTLGGMATFQPTASGSFAGRRLKRSAASLSTGLTSDDELALDLTPSAAQIAAQHHGQSRARDDVFRTMFADTSDSSDESWPESSSPPGQTTDADEPFAPMDEDIIPAQGSVLSMPIDDATPLLHNHSVQTAPESVQIARMAAVPNGLGLRPAIDLTTPRPAGPVNPYRRAISRPFSRVPSSGPPHPLSASYVPSPPAQSPAHCRPRLHSPTRNTEEQHLRVRSNDSSSRHPPSPLLVEHTREDSASSSSATWNQGETPRPARSEKVIWARVANDVFEHCQTSIVLDGRGLTYIDPIVADLGKMVTLPPPRKSPPRDATPGSTSKRRSLEAVAETSEDSGWIPSLKFGGIQLNLANNRLTMLPSALFQVENLRVLSLRGNNIRFLPPAISELANLKELSIGGNKIEYLPAEIQKLRLTTFNYFPNPFRKPPKSLPCPNASSAASNKSCVHQPRFRVRPTWEQLTMMSTAENSETSSPAAATTVPVVPVIPSRQPVRQKPAGLSLRPLLLTNLSFGQIGLSTEDLRTPSNPPLEDPLLQQSGEGSTPLAGSSSSSSTAPGVGEKRMMAPPPAPYRVSEQGPRFVNPSTSAPSALHTPTRIEEGATMDSMQLGATTVITAEPSNTTIEVGPPDVRSQLPDNRRARVFDRTRSEQQIRDVLDAYPGSGPMLGPAARAAVQARLGSSAEVAPVQRQSNGGSSAGLSRTTNSTSTPGPAESGPIQIENGRASYVGPTAIVPEGFPPLLGELCYRLLLSPSSSTTTTPVGSNHPIISDGSVQTPRQDEKRPVKVPATPELVLDRWDRDELARLRQAQDSSVLRTLEAARRSAGRSWGGENDSAADRTRMSMDISPVGDVEAADDFTSGTRNEQVKSGGAAGPTDGSVGDPGADASANPWFSRCPNPAHISTALAGTTAAATPTSGQHASSTRTVFSPPLSGTNGNSCDWPVPPAHRTHSPLFHRPAETRLEWVTHVAGLRIARSGVNTSIVHTASSTSGNSEGSGATSTGSVDSMGQVVSEEDCLPLLWRGCSKGCLDFLDR